MELVRCMLVKSIAQCQGWVLIYLIVDSGYSDVTNMKPVAVIR